MKNNLMQYYWSLRGNGSRAYVEDFEIRPDNVGVIGLDGNEVDATLAKEFQSMLHYNALQSMSLREIVARCKQSLITWHMPPLLAFALHESDRLESIRKAQRTVQLCDPEWVPPPMVDLGEVLPHLSLSGEPRYEHPSQMEL